MTNGEKAADSLSAILVRAVDLFEHLANLPDQLVRLLARVAPLLEAGIGPIVRRPATRPKRASAGLTYCHLGTERVVELLARYEAGESSRHLARAFGIHQATVLAHLATHGVDSRPNVRKLTDQQVAEATPKYVAGMSLVDLGRCYGVSGNTMRKELERAGVPIRRAGRP